MPERYVPPEVETKLDVQEDSESEFSEKVNKYLTEIKGNKTVISSNPGQKLSKSKIKHYAVNDMRTANER